MTDLMGLFGELDKHTEPESRDRILRAPFSYPGGKSRSVKQILPLLPYRERYVEPFGGSAAVMLARRPSDLEIFNDRYAGVVAFYRCLRDPLKMERLCEWLQLTIHAREEFVWTKETWKNVEDDVERAARWYYMTVCSFGSLGRNFGRSLSGRGNLCGKIQRKLKFFPIIHERFKNIQVENQDWEQCVRDYDSHDTVFYLDPPYVDGDTYVYKNRMTHDDHRHLLDVVFSLKGFVAVSGYPNTLYENRPWDDRQTWEAFISIKSAAYDEGNKKAHLKGIEERGHNDEVLWIKEAHE